MYYIIYKTTNLINGKYYIGKHQTKNLNDGYVGSGKYLKRAIKKYGIDNFHTEIIEIYDEEWKMNIAEKILVVIDSEVSYNLCPGGKGGFGYINKNTELVKKRDTKENKKLGRKAADEVIKVKYPNGIWYGKTHSEETKQKISDLKKGLTPFLGKIHKEETKQKISAANKINSLDSKNSQYNTCWVTDGIVNKKIKKEDLDRWISMGYYKGRKIIKNL